MAPPAVCAETGRVVWMKPKAFGIGLLLFYFFSCLFLLPRPHRSCREKIQTASFAGVFCLKTAIKHHAQHTYLGDGGDMPIKVNVIETPSEGRVLTIGVVGRFDLYSYGEFSAAYKDELGNVSKVVLDMSELEYLDSSALGMLLMLRERAGGLASQIEIANCTPAVAKILGTVKFDKLFAIRA